MKVAISITISDKELTNKKFSNKLEFDNEIATDNLTAYQERVKAAITDGINTFEGMLS